MHGEGRREPETRKAAQMYHGNTVSLIFVGLWGPLCVRARWLDPQCSVCDEFSSVDTNVRSTLCHHAFPRGADAVTSSCAASPLDMLLFRVRKHTHAAQFCNANSMHNCHSQSLEVERHGMLQHPTAPRS